MGVLNCQKCFHIDNKNEIITGNNILVNQNLIFDIDSHQSSLSPINNYEYFKNKLSYNKYKNKRIPFKLKKGSRNEEEYTTDLEFGTIEIPCDDYDSFENNIVNNNNNIECEENYNINEQKDSLENNNSENIKNSSDSEINNNLNNDNTNLNDFINEKIEEKRKNLLRIDDKQNENQFNEIINKDIPFYQNNFNLIQGDNFINLNNLKYNFYNNEIGLFNGNNYNYINHKIDEEKEEYEPEIISISDINKKYISSTFSQYELKNLEQNSLIDFKNSIKSEELRTKKGTKNEGSNKVFNYNISNKENQKDEESAISYEIEYIDENNNNLNFNYNEANLINKKENIEIINEVDLNKKFQKEKIILNFKENIEKKLNEGIGKVKNFHKQYIITDSFCDYKPEI